MANIYLTTLKFDNRINDIEQERFNSFEKSWEKVKRDLEFIKTRNFYNNKDPQAIMLHESWEECASPDNKSFVGPFLMYKVGFWEDNRTRHLACILVLSVPLAIGNF